MVYTRPGVLLLHPGQVQLVQAVPGPNLGLENITLFIKLREDLIFYQSWHLKLHQVHLKGCPQSRGVKLDGSTEANELHHLHVVDKRVTVCPGQGPRAVQRLLPHLLHRGQLVQGEGEGVDRVVDEGGGGVQVTFNSAVNEAS